MISSSDNFKRIHNDIPYQNRLVCNTSQDQSNADNQVLTVNYKLTMRDVHQWNLSLKHPPTRPRKRLIVTIPMTGYTATRTATSASSGSLVKEPQIAGPEGCRPAPTVTNKIEDIKTNKDTNMSRIDWESILKQQTIMKARSTLIQEDDHLSFLRWNTHDSPRTEMDGLTALFR